MSFKGYNFVLTTYFQYRVSSLILNDSNQTTQVVLHAEKLCRKHCCDLRQRIVCNCV